MRDSRKSIALDIESALTLMQEIYNDIVEQKSTASLITKKMLAFMKEADDMSVIGPVIKEQQKILADCMEKKVSLVKLQSALIKQVGAGDKGQGNGWNSKLQLSPEDRKILNELMDEKDDNDIKDAPDNPEYKT